MTTDSPAAILYDSDGYELAVKHDVAIPANTRGLLVESSDGTDARFIAVNLLGQQIVIGTGTDNTTISTAKLPVPAPEANESPPTWTDGYMVPLSVDTTGALRISGGTNSSIGLNGSTIPTSSTQIGGSDGTN